METDSWGLHLAKVASGEAQCKRRSVGAVTFDKWRNLVGAGANRGPDNKPSCLDGGCPRGIKSLEEQPAYAGDYSDCIATHAERASGDAKGGTMFVTDRPCKNCMDWIVGKSHLARVVWPGGEWVRDE